MIKKSGKQFFEVFAPSSGAASQTQPARPYAPAQTTAQTSGAATDVMPGGPRLLTIRLHVWAAAVIAVLAMALLAIAYFWGFQRGKAFALAPRTPNIPDVRVPAGPSPRAPAAPAPRTGASSTPTGSASLPGALAPSPTGISSPKPAPAPAPEAATVAKPQFALCLVTYNKREQAEAVKKKLEEKLGAEHTFLLVKAGDQGASIAVGPINDTTTPEALKLREKFRKMPFENEAAPFKGAYFVHLK